jgi:hypothetical protein
MSSYNLAQRGMAFEHRMRWAERRMMAGEDDCEKNEDMIAQHVLPATSWIG